MCFSCRVVRYVRVVLCFLYMFCLFCLLCYMCFFCFYCSIYAFYASVCVVWWFYTCGYLRILNIVPFDPHRLYFDLSYLFPTIRAIRTIRPIPNHSNYCKISPTIPNHSNHCKLSTLSPDLFELFELVGVGEVLNCPSVRSVQMFDRFEVFGVLPWFISASCCFFWFISGFYCLYFPYFEPSNL